MIGCNMGWEGAMDFGCGGDIDGTDGLVVVVVVVVELAVAVAEAVEENVCGWMCLLDDEVWVEISQEMIRMIGCFVWVW